MAEILLSMVKFFQQAALILVGNVNIGKNAGVVGGINAGKMAKIESLDQANALFNNLVKQKM